MRLSWVLYTEQYIITSTYIWKFLEKVDPAHFPVERMFLKRTEIINVNTLKMVGKWIRYKICHGIHWYAQVNSKYAKYYYNPNSLYLMYWDVNNAHRRAMSQKLPLDNFEWKDNISKFDKNFMKNYNEYSQKEYIFEVDIENSKQLQEYTMI